LGKDQIQAGSGSFALEEGWLFVFDPSASMSPPESKWAPVRVPHTWQALAGDPGYSGVAWYRLPLAAPLEWAKQVVCIEFEAVTHSAHVFLNGKPAGEHIGKGYTAFTCDLSPLLKLGAENILTVRIDNRPSDTMLPRNKSFDWADDGGLIRPVNLLVT